MLSFQGTFCQKNPLPWSMEAQMKQTAIDQLSRSLTNTIDSLTIFRDTLLRCESLTEPETPRIPPIQVAAQEAEERLRKASAVRDNRKLLPHTDYMQGFFADLLADEAERSALLIEDRFPAVAAIIRRERRQ